MNSISVVVVYHAIGDRLLLKRRARDPYWGLLDFIGDGCDRGEAATACAYRALQEAADIRKADIALEHIMDFAYHTTGCCVQVFAGQLEWNVRPPAGEQALQWVRTDENFFDEKVYAGEGYIGHILAHMRMQLFAPGQ